MSRIHDALKKAEEQNLANFGSVAPPVTEEMPVDSFPQDILEIVAGERDVPETLPELAPTLQPAPPEELPSGLRCTKTYWYPTKDALFLTATEGNSHGLEEFRTLRAKLFQTRAKRPLKTLLVSSALPAEGKSFVSANLAQAFARQRGGKTLLIDADLRKPHQHELLGAPPRPGLVEFLAGKVSESQVIQQSQFDDLYFIPGGSVAEGAEELIGNRRFAMLLERLAPLFNWIVIDSSPVVPVSDATRLAELCDGVLLVVRSGSTPFAMAERAKREFQSAPLLGVVLNRVPQKDHSHYKYGYGSYGKKRPYGSDMP